MKAGLYTLLLQDPIGPGIAKKSGNIIATGPIDLGDIMLDELPPAVGETTPANGAMGVALTPEIRVTFTEPIAATTINATTLSLIGPAGPVTGLIDVVGDSIARFRLLAGTQLQSSCALHRARDGRRGSPGQEDGRRHGRVVHDDGHHAAHDRRDHAGRRDERGIDRHDHPREVLRSHRTGEFASRRS